MDQIDLDAAIGSQCCSLSGRVAKMQSGEDGPRFSLIQTNIRVVLVWIVLFWLKLLEHKKSSTFFCDKVNCFVLVESFGKNKDHKPNSKLDMEAIKQNNNQFKCCPWPFMDGRARSGSSVVLVIQKFTTNGSMTIID